MKDDTEDKRVMFWSTGFQVNLDKEGDTFFEVACDWLQVFGKYNWYNFRLLHCEFEWDKVCCGVELQLALLGFTFRFRHNYATPEWLTKAEEEIKNELQD